MFDNPLVSNQEFLRKIASETERPVVEHQTAQYVKTQLLESAVSRSIIPQQPISTVDCQRNVNDNSLYVIRDIEPDAAAVGVDIYGEPTGRYIQGSRVIIPIVDFSTLRYQIKRRDLRAYQYKITKRIEEKSVPILEELEDKWFLKLCMAAVSTSSLTAKKATGGNIHADTEVSALKIPAITKGDMIMGKNILSGGIAGGDPKKKEVGCCLMTTETFNTSPFIPTYGDDYGKDRVENGVVTETLNGTRIVKSIKSNILPNGHLWFFTTPDFLGYNFSLGDPIFEIKSTFGLIEFQTDESVGMNISNSASLALRTLAFSTRPGVAYTAAWDGTTELSNADVLYVDTDGAFPVSDPGSGNAGFNTWNLLKYYEALEI